MAGSADDVMGLIERTVRGNVCLFGKRMGETNGLCSMLACRLRWTLKHKVLTAN